MKKITLLCTALAFAASGWISTPLASQQHAATTALPYDLQFIDMMRHHHADGIKMSQLEESRGRRDDVKAFAKRTREGQEKDSAELQAIRDRLFKDHGMADNARVAGMTMAAMMKKGQQDMARLEKAGASTDAVFLQIMAGHHANALRMSSEGMKRLQDPQLRKLAASMNAMQTKEQAEIRQLRR